jgi:hypothetical protein
VGKIDKLELENEHIADEMIEHLILEKVGGLPDHGHAKAIKLKRKIKKRKKNYNFEFFIIFGTIILGELWWLWSYINLQ